VLALGVAVLVVGCGNGTPFSDMIIYPDHLIPDSFVIADRTIGPDILRQDVNQPDGQPPPPDGPPPPPDGGPPPPDGGPPPDAPGPDGTPTDMPQDATVPPDASPPPDGPINPTAQLVINEVAPNISATNAANFGGDLVELRALTAGPVAGITLEQNVAPTTRDLLATLPDITVAAGDLIVVHLKPAASISSETTSKTSCAATGGCFDGAWDVAGSATKDVTFTDRVLALRGTDGNYQDLVVFVKTPGASNSHSGFETEVQNSLASGQWVGACGSPCSFTSTPAIDSIAVDWKNASTTTRGGMTVQRTGVADTSTSADWTVKASTIGASNN
jgi:hypothetical protein